MPQLALFRSTRVAVLAAAALAIVAPTATLTAHADAATRTWTLSGATFADGGTLTGSFVTDSSGNLISASFATSGGNTTTFAPRNYSYSGSLRGTSWTVPETGANLYSRFWFMKLTVTGSPLTASTLALDTASSYECYNCAPYRMVVSGSAVAGSTQAVTETVNGANLGFVSAPGAVTPPATTLNGVDEVTPSFSLPLDIGDATGSGNGWNVSLNATPFTDAHSRTLGALYQSTQPTPACDAATTCTKATDATHLVDLVKPLTYSSGNLVQVADAATGMGDQSVSPTFTLAVPANSYAGTYTSTWTVSLNSAPH